MVSSIVFPYVANDALVLVNALDISVEDTLKLLLHSVTSHFKMVLTTICGD
jgi:hypothetical protein